MTNPETASGDPAFQLPAGDNYGPTPAFQGAPAGAYTDAQYLAAEAQLRQQIGAQYGDILAQLGYVDPTTGQYVPGTVSQQAQLQEDQANQNKAQAVRGVTQNAQNSGILFSGIRGIQQADAEQPYQQQIAQLELSTPEQLASLYRQAGDLINQYHTQNAMLLQDAANRALANIEQNPVGTGSSSGGGTTGGGTTSSPTTSSPATPPPPAYASYDYPTPSQDKKQEALVALGKTPQYAEGGEVTHPQLASIGELSRPGDPSSHEVVIPRYRLTAKQNKTLDKLMIAAGVADAAAVRLR